MKMQLVGSGQAVKEKDFYCKAEFDNFESICRTNFDPRTEANPQASKKKEKKIKFTNISQTVLF